MKILVRMPNWLGDSVMATPALENLRGHYRDAKFVLVGSRSVVNLFQDDPRWQAVVVDPTRGRRDRLVTLWRFGRQLRRDHGPFHLAFCFASSVSSNWLAHASGAPVRVGLRRGICNMLLTHAIDCDRDAHVVLIYNEMINRFLDTEYVAGDLAIAAAAAREYGRETVGINPGAAHGSARRWDARRFGEVAAQLALHRDIVIFGGPGEEPMAAEVESVLRERGVANFDNLAGQLSISEMLSRLAGLSLFVTNDSGPMHLAGALRVPTVAVFGPTSHQQTRPWRHAKIAMVRHDVACAPCFKNICPLGHHACMTGVEVRSVLLAAQSLLSHPSVGGFPVAAAS